MKNSTQKSIDNLVKTIYTVADTFSSQAKKIDRREFLIDSGGFITGLGVYLLLSKFKGCIPSHKYIPKPENKMQNALEEYISKSISSGAIGSEEKVACLVYDLRTNEVLAAINEDEPMQAASMIKPFVALAYFHQLKNHMDVPAYNKNVRKRLNAMLRKSSNIQTDWLIDKLGGPKRVNEILHKNYGHIFQQTSIVETINENGIGRTYKNKASPNDYRRFLEALNKNELPYSSVLNELMRNHERNRIKKGVDEIPSETEIEDKTGSTGCICGDKGIIFAEDKEGRLHPYIFVAIIQNKLKNPDNPEEGCIGNGVGWYTAKDPLIRKMSGIGYEGMKERYNLK